MKANGFSLLANSMQGFSEEVQTQRELLSASPFPDSEMNTKAKAERIKKAIKDFWYFDRTYFPAEMYSDGYYEPCSMHKTIVELSQKNGVHIVFGPRGHGKTVTAKKVLVWQLITGQVRIAGTYSETIDKARNILNDIAELIQSNDRIINDFEPEIKVHNADKLQLRFHNAPSKQWRFVQPFSEGRSVRGYGRLFLRPQIILADDVETLESSMQTEAVERRINKIAEAFQSLSEKKRTILLLGNDFDRNSALHRIRTEQDNGILVDSWRVYVFKAWQDNNRPLWAARYKAKTEAALKALLQPRTEEDWQANFQQNPVPPEGIYFKRGLYQEWATVPDDAKGVIYCDPNLSEKGQGDTTGVTALKFSADTLKFYIVGARCKSFSGSTDLLDALLDVREKYDIKIVGFDGHVAQASAWKDNIKNWCKIRKRPYPQVEFKRYGIDELAKNAQMAYEMGDVLFPPGFAHTPEGEVYLQQFFAFRGKKAKKKDDAPDSFIGAFELLHERRMIKRGRNLLLGRQTSIVVRSTRKI